MIFNFTQIMGNWIATIQITTQTGETYHLRSSIEKSPEIIIEKALTLFKAKGLITN